MQRMLRVIALTAMAIGVASGAFAQVASTGTIEVFVTDQQEQALPGATVEASAVDTTTKRVAVTDENGKAVLELLAPSELYTVKITMQGFKEQLRENQRVRVAQVLTLRTALALPGVEEAVTVSAETTPLVDVTSATTGQDITLRLTESLPTGRSYQSYLQLVPGVMPDDPSAPGNPASRSGLNYSDIGGALGVSTDNLYYLDGINVTDPLTGTFGANMNTEVIAEQKVTTGGISAQFPGTPGLLSQVVTKSGSNNFSGSANYFFQNTDLVAENKHGAAEEFSTDDTAFTFGGPAWMNKAWFFGSYRYFKRADDVSAIDTQQLMRSVENKQKQGFAKGTFAPSGNDTASFSYLGDPTLVTGSRERNRPNSNDRSQDQGGHRYAGTYTRLFGNFLVEGNAFKHNGEVSLISAIRDGNNAIVYRTAQPRTITDDFLGGFGIDQISERDLWGTRVNAQYNWRNHTFRTGFEFQKNENFRDTVYLDSTYTSLAPINSGLTLADVAGQTGMTFSRRDFLTTTVNDFAGLINGINQRSDRQRYYDAFDADRNGVITAGELGPRAVLNSSAGNPDAGFINYDRTVQVEVGPQLTSSKGFSLFVSDTWRLNRFTFDVGLRTEQWKHYATTGANIYTFEWAFAPRLSAIYDLRGDGRQKLSAFWGRYYDPIRNNMTNFAGTLTGSILQEQVYLLGDWVTYRTRGGPIVQDAFFAPTTKTPYTDELQFGYEIDLGHNMSVGAIYYNRRTRDILEDYDLSLYALDEDGHTSYPGPIDHPDSLWLGLDYFGYTQNPGSNFVIATLEGGKRDANGIELSIRKRFENNWQWQASYNYLDADGNNNSDSNADFAGDVLYLDPRAPNAFGRQPGTIRHLFKTAGSYTFNFGLQLGAVAQFNSGTLSSRTASASGRNLPDNTGGSFVFAGIDPIAADIDPWILPGSVGGLSNEAWGQLDLRAQYVYRFRRVATEFFVDLFNVTDSQSTIRNQDLVAGQGGIAFGEGLLFVPPRRAFLGVRARF
jgi:hypothetical protein